METGHVINEGLMRLLLITLTVQLLLFAGDCNARIINRTIPPKGESPSAPATGSGDGVRVNATAGEVVLDNGIVQVTFANPEGFVTGIRYGGLDNVLATTNKENDRGYWDIASSDQLDGDGTDEMGMIGKTFKIIKQTEDMAEISFLCPQTSAAPIVVDKRFIMLRGRSGFYSYAIFEREKGLPALNITQIRAVYKLQREKFNYLAVSDKIQRTMPMPQDRTTGQPLAFKEAVLLTKPINPLMKGQVDDKYEYSQDDKDVKVIGWISFDPPIGFWLITPTDEYRMAGPVKQDLTAHAGPILLEMFHSIHYGGKNLTMSFQKGEPWKKVFGPFYVHLNSLSGKGEPRSLWQSAKDQMAEEVKSWPYDFALSEDFPKANQRGSVAGTLLVNDGGKAPVPAASAWVGLAAPGVAGSWQNEMKGYQFWVQADKDGKFLIPNVRVGTYSLYAFVPGFIGDYKAEKDLIIAPGKQINVGNLVYVPPRDGPTLWEIGIPDRTAAEFYVPDPLPNLANPLFLKDPENKYRQYGLWDRYTDLYPERDLVYKVGVSDYKKDWFFAHVLRRQGGRYVPTTWQVIFPLKAVLPNGMYTLQIALASASDCELQVRVNTPNLTGRPLFTTLLIGKDNAIARHGIHGMYWLYSIKVPSSVLRPGDNTIFLTQSRGVQQFRGLMYDYLRLEGPSSA